MEMLQVNSLSKIYGGKVTYRALTDIDFTIRKGEFVGIMGPSGSGKTTLLNMISTIDSPTWQMNRRATLIPSHPAM
jgi:putative ABC transport system ATP-binding protein